MCQILYTSLVLKYLIWKHNKKLVWFQCYSDRKISLFTNLDFVICCDFHGPGDIRLYGTSLTWDYVTFCNRASFWKKVWKFRVWYRLLPSVRCCCVSELFMAFCGWQIFSCCRQHHQLDFIVFFCSLRAKECTANFWYWPDNPIFPSLRDRLLQWCEEIDPYRPTT